jgi:hypothetical protein
MFKKDRRKSLIEKAAAMTKNISTSFERYSVTDLSELYNYYYKHKQVEKAKVMSSLVLALHGANLSQEELEKWATVSI